MHIRGIGIDIVDVSRFAGWETRTQSQLLSVFSAYELAEAEKLRSSERKYEFFASRFAVKEAFYKALSCALVQLGLTKSEFSFQRARGHIEVKKTTWEVPTLSINWGALEELIGQKLPEFIVHLSLAHERSCAVAIVIIEQKV